MISCTRFDELLEESLGGDLDAERRREFEAHVTACPPCLAILKSYLRAGAMAAAAYPESDVPAQPLAEDRVRAVMAHVRAHTAGSDAASGVA